MIFLAMSKYEEGGKCSMMEKFAGFNMEDQRTNEIDGTDTRYQMQVVSCTNGQFVTGDLTQAPGKLGTPLLGDLNVTVKLHTAPVGMLYKAFSLPIRVNWAVYLWRAYHSTDPNITTDHDWFRIYGTKGRIARISSALAGDVEGDALSMTLTATYWDWWDRDMGIGCKHTFEERGEGEYDPNSEKVSMGFQLYNEDGTAPVVKSCG